MGHILVIAQGQGFMAINEPSLKAKPEEKVCLRPAFPVHEVHVYWVGYIVVIAWVARDLWRHKQTLSSGFVLGLGSFTAINPWPCAITIT